MTDVNIELLVLHSNTWNHLTGANKWIMLNRIISVK